MANENAAWELEDFIDSLVVDLDKTRETLAVKAINKPLSYTVKDLALDLNIFPSYDGDQVKFITAQPGQAGASKVTIQLSSITDQQVRATSNLPSATNDVTLDQVNLDNKTKKELRKLGVNSVDDLKQIEKKNVDLKKVTDDAIDYKDLANRIESSRRNQVPPKVNSVSFSVDEHKRPYLHIQGEHLALNPNFPPVVAVNQTLAEVMSSSPQEVKIRLGGEHNLAEMNEVIMTFDPYAVIKVNVKVPAAKK
jgi:hypothetical protein